MSFRNRLGLFFIVIVIVPMLAVAFQLFGLIGESVEGQANAGVVARHKVATQLYERYRRAAAVALTEVATDARMKKLLLVGNKKAAAERARQLVKGQAIERIVLVKGSSIRFSRGDPTAIAPAVRDVVSERGTTLTNLGALQVSVVDAGSFARETKSLTRQEGRRKNGRLLKGEKDVPGLDIVVRDAEKVLASTVPSDIARSLPTNETEVSVNGQKFLALTFEDPWGFARQKLSVTTLGSLESPR